MLDKTIEKVEKCILKKQGGDRINWTRAAKEIGLPKTTLWQIFKDERSPTWKNLSKILEYIGCYISYEGERKSNSAKGAVARGKGKR